MSFWTKAVAAIFLILLMSAGVLAQSQITTGVIQGRVLDETGAVIPGAEVAVLNVDTNLERKLVTSEDGRFVVAQLPPGPYRLTVNQPGFATLVQENLTVTVGSAIRLDLTLQVSDVQQTITVSGTPTLDTTKTESSSTLNQVVLDKTPVLGRKFEDLLTLTPGVSVVQGPDGDEINFNGQRGIFNNISLDGGDYNNGFFGEQAGGQRAAIDITIDAIQEFQVIATGASAEFGRTAGGVVNVVTKSGTNDVHGSLFHFQRLEALSANTSDGQPLLDFHREQFGGTIGGPLKQDKAFYFFAVEQILGNLTRNNLSVPIGDPCPVATPNILTDEGLIAGSADCQRLALLDFFRTNFNQEEGLPVERPVNTTAILAKIDVNINPSHTLSTSYNFTRSEKENETFDVSTYGNSANGTEGPAKIQAFNFNLFSNFSPTALNEAHFTYGRENRPRTATPSNVAADIAAGFATTFRFGNPFFLQPNIDELFWRTQVRDTVTWIKGNHTVKFGGEWLHSLNDQVFRGFFTSRFIFASVPGLLRYASDPALGPGYGPTTASCTNGAYTDVRNPTCTVDGGPLLLFLQGAGRDGAATDAAGASNISNEDFALFVQDKWQVHPNFTLNLGLRWEAQLFPEPVVPPAETAYGPLIGTPGFPSDGTLPDQTKQFQPRLGFAWDIGGSRNSVLRGSAGIYYGRQNMLTQVGSITTNGVQQQTIFLNTEIIGFGVPPPSLESGVTPAPVPPGTFPLFTGVRVFSSDYENPRITTFNVAYEQRLASDWTVFVDFTRSKGVHLTRFVNANADGRYSPQLGEVAVTQSSAKSLYRGVTVGMRKRYSQGYQLQWNYTYSRDEDDDSNERDPFTFRAFDPNNFNLDYALSDRDIAHKFSLVSSFELPKDFELGLRRQGRSAQPITPSPRVVNGVDLGRNTLRKDNEFFSFDWRLERAFRFGDRFAIIALAEMFNTFNNDNNINPLTTPGLFNFDGFLRQGVGDPRQLQLAIRFTF